MNASTDTVVPLDTTAAALLEEHAHDLRTERRGEVRTLPTHAQRIGARLRRIRNQQQLSLADVQHRSGGVWKAVVVGAYERGDRAVTVTRLAELANFYGVPLHDLLPGSREPAGGGGQPTTGGQEADQRIILDLTRLDEKAPGLKPVARFVDHVRSRRGDHNGRIMTLRGGDVETVAMAAGRTTAELIDDLTGAGALLAVDLNGAPTVTVRSFRRQPQLRPT